MQEGKYHVVTTKVTPEAKEKLNRIAEAFGISRYQLFQLFALVCVRLWDKPAALSDEHRVLLGEFLQLRRELFLLMLDGLLLFLSGAKFMA